MNVPAAITDNSRGKYSVTEIEQIYSLARFYLECGDLRKAETVAKGLSVVAPDFPQSFLVLSYVYVFEKRYDEAIQAAEAALKLSPKSTEAQLFLAACLLTTGDMNAAGTYLGEVGDKIDSGEIMAPDLLRFYKMQLARFQNR